jgi:hypothetical protein
MDRALDTEEVLVDRKSIYVSTDSDDDDEHTNTERKMIPANQTPPKSAIKLGLNKSNSNDGSQLSFKKKRARF